MPRPTIESLVQSHAQGEKRPGLDTWLELYAWEAFHDPWERSPEVKDEAFRKEIQEARKLEDFADLPDLQLKAYLEEDPMFPAFVSVELSLQSMSQRSRDEHA